MAFGFSENTNDPMNPDGPATIERRRRLAEALIQQGTSTAPIKSWTEGVANIAKAMLGGYDMRQADAAERDARKRSDARWDDISKSAMAPAVGAPQTPAPSLISGLGAAPVASATPSTAMTAADGTAKPVAGRDEFIASMMPHALEVSKATGIDPRIVIAQGALESGWGKSAPGNNFFGIKSHGVPGGQTLATTENVGGQNVATSDSFRTYGDMGESARGYGEFLKLNPRYKPVLEAQGMDAQIAALAKSGYATDPMYGNKIAQIAKSLQLPEAGAPQQVASAAMAYAPQPTATDAQPSRVGDPRYPNGQPPGEIPPMERTPFVPAGGFSGGEATPPARSALVAALANTPASPDGSMSGAAASGPRVAASGPQAIARALVGSPPSGGVSRAAAGFIPEIDQPHTTNPAQVAAGGPAAAPASGQRLAQALTPQQPQPPAQASPAAPSMDKNMALAIQIMKDPWADASQKAVAGAILQKHLVKTDPQWEKLNDGTLYDKRTGRTMSAGGPAFRMLTDPAERSRYGIPASDAKPYQLDAAGKLSAVGGGTTVNIDQKGEGAFETEAAKAQAKRFDEAIQGAQKAQSMMGDIQTMRDISGRVGSVGASANLKAAIGPYAEAVGVNLDGLSDIQAFESVIQRLAPQMRATGSGATSDIEFKGFLASLPRLSSNPQARAVILDTMEAGARYNIAQGEIASRVFNKEMTKSEGEKALRELGNPMAAFREFKAKNPNAFTSQGSVPATNAAPRPAPDGREPVRVASPEDARKLPKGTPIILPDGRTGVVP